MCGLLGGLHERSSGGGRLRRPLVYPDGGRRTARSALLDGRREGASRTALLFGGLGGLTSRIHRMSFAYYRIDTGVHTGKGTRFSMGWGTRFSMGWGEMTDTIQRGQLLFPPGLSPKRKSPSKSPSRGNVERVWEGLARRQSSRSTPNLLAHPSRGAEHTRHNFREAIDGWAGLLQHERTTALTTLAVDDLKAGVWVHRPNLLEPLEKLFPKALCISIPAKLLREHGPGQP